MTTSPQTHNFPSTTLARAREYEDKLRRARATELALAGRFMEAESLFHQHPLDVADLDLLARIQVRRGRLEAARHTWQQAISMNDSSTALKECLSTLEVYRTARYQRHLLIWRIGLGVWLILLMAFTWWLV